MGSPRWSEPIRRVTPISLSPWSRLLSSLLGAAGLGLGGLAVFIRDVEAGPVALIAVGAVFVMIALGGVLPTRLKIGDNEVEIAALGRAFAEVVDDAPPRAKAELSATIEQLSLQAPNLAAPAVAGLAYVSMVQNLIVSIVDSDAQLSHVALERGDEPRFDALIQSDTHKTVAIEIRAVPRFDDTAVDAMAAQLRYLQERSPVDAMLAVIRYPPTIGGFSSLFRSGGGVRFVVVNGPEDRNVLHEAIRAAAGLS
jgi:hypothetical protein